MSVEHRLNVRETAERLGVHENTIRNWEQKGLLRAVRLPGSGYRRFEATEVARLHKEMLSTLAPADEGPIIRARRPTRVVAEAQD
jgi:excisionase family DNA binding protein